jgi:hypothetical protein
VGPCGPQGPQAQQLFEVLLDQAEEPRLAWLIVTLLTFRMESNQ